MAETRSVGLPNEAARFPAWASNILPYIRTWVSVSAPARLARIFTYKKVGRR